jgi:hypothetical protein
MLAHFVGLRRFVTRIRSGVQCIGISAPSSTDFDGETLVVGATESGPANVETSAGQSASRSSTNPFTLKKKIASHNTVMRMLLRLERL